MKKPPKDYRDRQVRICQRRLEASLRGRQLTGKAKKTTEPLATILHRDQWVMPVRCSFSQDFVDESLKNITELKALVLQGRKVLLDFTETTQITATYAVYFFSQLQDLIDISGSYCVRVNLKSLNHEMRFLLKESGILTLTNGTDISVGGKGFLPIICGQKDDRIDTIIDFIISVASASGNLSEDPHDRAHAELLTSRAITEAMLNVDYHAYPETDQPKWWWFTAVIVSGDLFISLCDAGVGIPNTLPRTDWWVKLKGMMPINDDAGMIQLAMEYTRTSARTKKGRGLGTKDIQNLVIKQGKGFLTIISGQGYYTLDGSGGGTQKTRTLSTPIVGTTINWRIPLGKQNEK